MIGWYICPYKIRQEFPGAPRNMRYCAMDDYTQVIFAKNGNWTETEILGDRAIVKVRAPQGVLNALNGVFKRLPKNHLNDSLSDLPAGVKTALKNELLDMGYSLIEIKNRFGSNLGQYTLRDVLKFAARRRLKPRYHSGADEIILDGPVQACRTLELVDNEVQE